MLSLLIVGNSYHNARSKLLVPSSCLRRLCDWTEAYIDLLRRLWCSRTSEGKHGKSYASIRIVTQSLQCTGCGLDCHKRSVSKQEIHHPTFPAVGLSASLSAAVCGDTIARLRLSNSWFSRIHFFRAFVVCFWLGFLFHPRAGLGLSMR